MAKVSLFTLEDAKAAFTLFCGIYGIGTLGMPGNFSRAGPILATVAMAFMALANTYSSVAICRVMLLAPRSARTYGDIGEWCMGRPGRYISVTTQIINCLMIPCMFLVLGGSLLDGLFPGGFGATTWIILMAFSCLPVCMVPTLKEGAAIAFAGCMATLIADVISVTVVMHGMRGHPSVPPPDINIKQVVGTFGNLALAYGAGILIPALQRQHSNPERMPRVVGVTMAFISCCFLVLASTAYSSVGCQISGNLLWSIYPDSVTGLTTLGFASDRGMVVLAYLFMQLHITIAFSVALNPAFYFAERIVLGMHKPAVFDIENNVMGYATATTPADVVEHSEKESRVSKRSSLTITADESEQFGDSEVEAAEYRGANTFKYVILRIVIIFILVVASVLLKDHFHDLADFVGKNLFAHGEDDTSFPFCAAEFENVVYYNYSMAHDSKVRV
ncbi:unnamed protein product [Peronospora belbahrii]|uniref:Amino acid transporter transmembrane domain-containing protein n=1 Tax=Peronospora belbahrii TaxID=622444 RepID=A0AAU9L7P7_9STRA|nr:unnamed protein product [Peronospora belbahrii]